MIEGKKDLICQSCGNPMDDQTDHDTTSDGGYHNEYRKYCVQDGKLVDKGIMIQEKIAKNINIAVSTGMDEKKGIDLAHSTIPHLKK